MDSSDNYYSPEVINERNIEKRRVDFDDLQNEIAGRDTGKISRFISEEERKRRSGRETSAQRATQTQLQMMLMQPEYAQAYYGAVHALNSAEDAVYDALKESADAVNDARKALEEAEKRGASEDELERLREIHKEAQERHERMLARDAELQTIRRRIEDPNSALSPDELAALEKRMKEIESDVRNEKEAPKSAPINDDKFDIETPDQANSTNQPLNLEGFSPL